MKRQADLSGGMAQAIGGVLGSIIGTIIEPVGGTILGGTLGSVAGKALDTAFHIPISGESNEAAYAGLWQQRSGQGLNGDRAREITEQIFQYERSTGADRETLTSLANMSARFNAGDALRAGWAGLGASGMSSGQYNEYLRAIQRTLEEGINKGFVRSSDQVVENFTMLAKIGGDDPTWKGEHGARRLSDMNAGLASTTGLQSSSDILAHRAARQIWGDNIPYNRIMEHTEEALSGEKGTEFFNKTIRLAYGAEGGGEEGTVERIRQMYNQDYKGANKIFDAWLKAFKENGIGIQEADLKELIEKNKNAPLPNVSSPELEWAQLTAQTANITVQTGQIKFDELLPKLREERDKAIEELRKTTTPTRAEQIAEELAPLGPMGKGMAIQANRVLESQEANDLEGAIRKSRMNSNVNGMLLLGMRETSRSPAVTPFFNKGENDDMSAYNRLISYRDSDDPQTQRAFLEAIEIMKSFSEAERIKANQTNTINSAIPDVMTDKTGQLLLEEIRKLCDMTITIVD